MGSPLGIKFWGTRGLISSPRRETAIYGGNTTCMQIIYKDHLIIVDTGFGACNLGEKLMQKILTQGANLQIHVFYTHFHWDHIQGLPFFHPIYFSSTTLNIYSPLPANVAYKNLDQLFDGSYSPFSGIHSMASMINIHELFKTVVIDGLTIDFTPVDHGDDDFNSTCFALKFQCQSGESIVIATDHEARNNSINKNLIEFAKNSTILVHDAQYDEVEYKNRIGWGHSTIQAAMENADKCSTERLILTHHHPLRNDAEIISQIQKYKSKSEFEKTSFDFAKELAQYDAVSSVKMKANK